MEDRDYLIIYTYRLLVDSVTDTVATDLARGRFEI